MPFNVLVFDLDGTISDPFEGIFNCINVALEAHDLERASAADVRRMIGPPLTEIFGHLVGAVSEEKMLSLVSAYRERYAVQGYAENVIYPGMTQTLTTLGQRGFTMGVCTSKRADYAAKIVEMFGLAELFSFIDGGDIHIKKVTQLERLVASGLDPELSVMIGDRAVDIDAARANGIATVGVCWGFAGEGEIEAARPDHIVRAPAELLELFP